MEKKYKIVLKLEKEISEEEFQILNNDLKKGLFKKMQDDGWRHSLEKQKLKNKVTNHILARYPAETIFKLIRSKVEFFKFENYNFSIAKKRYMIFADNPFCVCCGIEGTEMVLEKPQYDAVPHFNLYAYTDEKMPILMTKDHIHPVSKGGDNDVDNLQTMCSKCNNMKSNCLLDPEQIKDLRELYANYDNKIKSEKDRKKVLNLMKFFMEK